MVSATDVAKVAIVEKRMLIRVSCISVVVDECVIDKYAVLMNSRR